MTDTQEKPRPRYGRIGLAVAAVFGLFYAYDLWEAVSNFFELPAVYEQFGLDGSAVPWWVLILGLAIPPLVFVGAFLLGRRQSLAGQALIFLVGLAVVAGLSLGMISLVSALLRGLF